MASPGELVSFYPSPHLSKQAYEDGIGGKICCLCKLHVSVISDLCTHCMRNHGIVIEAVGLQEITCIFHGRARGRFRCGFVGCIECACSLCCRFHHSEHHFIAFSRAALWRKEQCDNIRRASALRARKLGILLSYALPKDIVSRILEYDITRAAAWAAASLQK